MSERWHVRVRANNSAGANALGRLRRGAIHDPRVLAPSQFEDATRALLHQGFTVTELKALLSHPHSAVRGTTIPKCLDRPAGQRTRALKAAAPWALDLPCAKR